MTAATQCPECPSDTADVEIIRWERLILGFVFTCVVCRYPNVVWH